MSTTTEEITVGIGTEFRSTYADSNALWRVTGKAGPNVWHAEIQPEWAEIRGERMQVDDYAGATDVFTTDRIAGSLNMSNVFARRGQRADDFWADREIGEILHYHHGFGQYVRGRVAWQVRDGDEGRNVLIPTALVGQWRDHDLVKWTPWGEVSKGYHVRKIEEGEGWQPNDGCVYECPDFSGPRGDAAGIDPTVLDAIDLTPPERTAEEVDYHEAIALRNKVKGFLGDARPQSAEEVYALLADVKAMLP